MTSKSEQALGRIIHAHIDVTLTPPPAELGETDAAMDIGNGIVREALLLLQTIAEAEGFTVAINIKQVVF